MDVATTISPAPNETEAKTNASEDITSPNHAVLDVPEAQALATPNEPMVGAEAVEAKRNAIGDNTTSDNAILTEEQIVATMDRRMRRTELTLMRLVIAVAHVTMLCLHQFQSNALVAAYLVLDVVVPVPTRRISKQAHKATVIAVQMYGVIVVAGADWDSNTAYTRALLIYCVCCITFRLHVQLRYVVLGIAYAVVSIFLLPWACGACYTTVEQRRRLRRALRRLQPALVRSLTDIHDVCAVCIDPIEVGAEILTLPCNHKFHVTCVSPWLRQNGTCPTCRGNITEE